MTQARQRGPLLTDEKFFLECLKPDLPGMEQVRSAASAGRYKEAKAAFAAYIRNTLQPDRFFTIPYEEPENICRYAGETDAQACRRLREHTMISVGVPCAFGRTHPVDWQANPTSNGYREWTWQLNRHHELKLLAHEYRRTGESWLADTAAELFESWVHQALYPGECEGYQTECWRTIECGIRMGCTWPYTLFAFYKSPAFTDQVLTDWYKSIWEHGDRLSRHHMTGNWLIMEMNGLAQISILYPLFVQTEEWRRQAFSSLEEELGRQIYPDGFQYELTTGYHDVVINNYQRMIEVAGAFDIAVPEAMLKRLSAACELDVKLMMPDGRLPDINDGKWLSVKEVLGVKKRILPRDPRLRWVLRGDAAGRPPYESVELPWSGFLVMRTGWRPESAWALFDAGPFGRAHQHEDKLSVLFYANGKLLVTEGGNYAYDDSPMRRYVLSTRAHNTVRVDGLDQNRRENYRWQEEEIRKRSDLRARIGAAWDFGEGRYTEGYGEGCRVHMTHERRVFFYKPSREAEQPLLIVVDRMEGSDAHRCEWLWHVDSALETDGMGEPLPLEDGVRFTELDVLTSGGEARVICGQETPEWQGFVATGTEQGMYRPIPCVCVAASGSRLRMVTVLAPYTGQSRRIRSVEASLLPEEEELVLHYEDGGRLVLRERDLMQ